MKVDLQGNDKLEVKLANGQVVTVQADGSIFIGNGGTPAAPVANAVRLVDTFTCDLEPGLIGKRVLFFGSLPMKEEIARACEFARAAIRSKMPECPGRARMAPRDDHSWRIEFSDDVPEAAIDLIRDRLAYLKDAPPQANPSIRLPATCDIGKARAEAEQKLAQWGIREERACVFTDRTADGLWLLEFSSSVPPDAFEALHDCFAALHAVADETACRVDLDLGPTPGWRHACRDINIEINKHKPFGYGIEHQPTALVRDLQGRLVVTLRDRRGIPIHDEQIAQVRTIVDGLLAARPRPSTERAIDFPGFAEGEVWTVENKLHASFPYFARDIRSVQNAMSGQWSIRFANRVPQNVVESCHALTRPARDARAKIGGTPPAPDLAIPIPPGTPDSEIEDAVLRVNSFLGNNGMSRGACTALLRPCARCIRLPDETPVALRERARQIVQAHIGTTKPEPRKAGEAVQGLLRKIRDLLQQAGVGDRFAIVFQGACPLPLLPVGTPCDTRGTVADLVDEHVHAFEQKDYGNDRSYVIWGLPDEARDAIGAELGRIFGGDGTKWMIHSRSDGGVQVRIREHASSEQKARAKNACDRIVRDAITPKPTEAIVAIGKVTSMFAHYVAEGMPRDGSMMAIRAQHETRRDECGVPTEVIVLRHVNGDAVTDVHKALAEVHVKRCLADRPRRLNVPDETLAFRLFMEPLSEDDGRELHKLLSALLGDKHIMWDAAPVMIEGRQRATEVLVRKYVSDAKNKATWKALEDFRRELVNACRIQIPAKVDLERAVQRVDAVMTRHGMDWFRGHIAGKVELRYDTPWAVRDEVRAAIANENAPGAASKPGPLKIKLGPDMDMDRVAKALQDEMPGLPLVCKPRESTIEVFDDVSPEDQVAAAEAFCRIAAKIKAGQAA